MLLMALVLIPCSVKQIIKGNIVSTNWSSTSKSNSKICQTTLSKSENFFIKKEQGKHYPFLNKYTNHYTSEIFLTHNIIEKFSSIHSNIPKYLLHCLFRI